MNCPNCGSERGWVAETRPRSDGTVRRRRRCIGCNRGFVTVEVVVPDGVRGTWDLVALPAGVLAALTTAGARIARIQQLSNAAEPPADPAQPRDRDA